jgi:Ca2+-binding RTX toxin-like protein
MLAHDGELRSDWAADSSFPNLGSDGPDVLGGTGGADLLDGKGGADVLYGYGGNDTYFVDNMADLVIEAGGAGADTIITNVSYQLAAGQEIELLRTYGSAGTDPVALTGNEFANTIVGNDGANRLDGKGGADMLFGYGGSDTFAFTTALGGGNVDTIGDFQTGLDKIALDQSVFTGLALGTLAAGAFHNGSTAQDADDRILYNSATGALYFDADGIGGVGAVQFATLSAVPLAGDFLVI